MIRLWKHPNYRVHFLGWLQGFCELADGLVTILSFGFYSSGFEMKMACFRAKVQIGILKKSKTTVCEV